MTMTPQEVLKQTTLWQRVGIWLLVPTMSVMATYASRRDTSADYFPVNLTGAFTVSGKVGVTWSRRPKMYVETIDGRVLIGCFPNNNTRDCLPQSIRKQRESVTVRFFKYNKGTDNQNIILSIATNNGIIVSANQRLLELKRSQNGDASDNIWERVTVSFGIGMLLALIFDLLTKRQLRLKLCQLTKEKL